MSSASSFWGRVDKAGTCWNWTGPLDSKGYGHLRWQEHTWRAHRLAWILTHGPIPPGEGHHGTVVMHKCDNRICCNPDHLQLGTHKANMADMKAKGRRKHITAGERNGRTVLNWELVERIRSDPRGYTPIAGEYGVHKSQIQRIKTGKQWVATASSSRPQ